MKKLNLRNPLCACGCGKHVKWNKWNKKWNKFLFGHANKGKKWSTIDPNSTLTQQRLKELLHYNSKTGVFKWLMPRSQNAKAGDIAGHKRTDGYISIVVDGKTYFASRLAFLYMEGYIPEHEVDHINRIKDDNRWKNLRHVTAQCNVRNRLVQKNNNSGITGVHWNKQCKRWVCFISIYHKRIHLGYFNTLKEAAKARWKAEVKYDFPNCNSTSSAYQFLKEGDTHESR